MSKVIKLKRGLDIRLVGEAEKTVVQMPVGSTYAVVPDSFPRITPKLLVLSLIHISEPTNTR